jgi:hypothetical protein
VYQHCRQNAQMSCETINYIFRELNQNVRSRQKSCNLQQIYALGIVDVQSLQFRGTRQAGSTSVESKSISELRHLAPARILASSRQIPGAQELEVWTKWADKLQ